MVDVDEDKGDASEHRNLGRCSFLYTDRYALLSYFGAFIYDVYIFILFLDPLLDLSLQIVYFSSTRFGYVFVTPFCEDVV